MQVWALGEYLNWKQEQAIRLEEERLKTLMAIVNPELYKHMFGKADPNNIEWHTPRSQEEVDQLMTILAGTHRRTEEVASSVP